MSDPASPDGSVTGAGPDHEVTRDERPESAATGLPEPAAGWVWDVVDAAVCQNP